MTATFFCPQGGRCEEVLRSTIMVLFQLIGVFVIYVCWKFDLKQYIFFFFREGFKFDVKEAGRENIVLENVFMKVEFDSIRGLLKVNLHSTVHTLYGFTQHPAFFFSKMLNMMCMHWTFVLSGCLESRLFSQHFEVKQPQLRPTTDVRKERFRMTFYRVNGPRNIQVDGFSNWKMGTLR